jgi:hypothetical protein
MVTAVIARNTIKNSNNNKTTFPLSAYSTARRPIIKQARAETNETNTYKQRENEAKCIT